MSARVTETDRVIIQHLRANARMPNAELAEHAHLSESQCSRRLRELERAEVIQQYVAVINLTAVDLPIKGIIEIRLGGPTKSGMEAFERAMNEMPSITDCWHTSGDANYILSASVSDPPAYDRVLDELVAINGVSIIRSFLVLRNVKPTTQAVPSRQSHRAGIESSSPVTSLGTSPRASTAHAGTAKGTGQTSRKRLDELDRRILGVLSANARIGNAELARRIGLSSAPCLRRVRALEKAGIIQKYTAVVDGDVLNLVLAVVRVQFQYENRQLRRLFEQRLFEIPEIGTVFRTNGESDYLLVVETSALKSLERLLVDSLLTHPGVKSLQSSIRLRNCFHRTSKLRGVVLSAPAHGG